MARGGRRAEEPPPRRRFRQRQQQAAGQARKRKQWRRRECRCFGLSVALVWIIILIVVRLWTGSEERGLGSAFEGGPFCAVGREVTASGPKLGVSDNATGVQQQQQQQQQQLIDSRTFTIATYNALWLFDGWQDAHRSVDTADQHIADVARVVAGLNADVVNVVELENCYVLSKVAELAQKVSSHGAREAAPDGLHVYVPQSADSSARQTVGVISKYRLQPPGARRSPRRLAYPVDGSNCGYLPPPRGHRSSGLSKHWFGVYSFSSGMEVLVVGVHFKARPNHPQSCAQREAQARIVVDIVNSNRVGHNGRTHREIVVLGDFNDFDSGVPDMMDNKPNSDVLHQLTAGLGLASVHKYIAKDDRYTWSGDGFPASAMDFILVSPGLESRLERAWVDRSQVSAGVSDHQPLLAKFRL